MRHGDWLGGSPVDRHPGYGGGPWIGMRCTLKCDCGGIKTGAKGTVTGERQLGKVRVRFDGESQDVRVDSHLLQYRPQELIIPSPTEGEIT